jgi:hypothetical protein
MTTLQTNAPWPFQDILGNKHKTIKAEAVVRALLARLIAFTRVHLFGSLYFILAIMLINLLTLFLFAGTVLQLIDPTAGVMDIGILSVLILGLLGGLLSIFCSIWLQELLWQPFKIFRQHFQSHFNQLTSWQQCILYFSVFFLLVYALLWALAVAM